MNVDDIVNLALMKVTKQKVLTKRTSLQWGIEQQ